MIKSLSEQLVRRIHQSDYNSLDSWKPWWSRNMFSPYPRTGMYMYKCTIVSNNTRKQLMQASNWAAIAAE